MILGDRLPHVVDRGFVGDIDVSRLGLAARLLGERCGIVGGLEIAVGADHSGAEGRKPERERAAQAVAGAGDHGDLAVEAEQIFEHCVGAYYFAAGAAADLAKRRST